jgi:putative flippase GtrA
MPVTFVRTVLAFVPAPVGDLLRKHHELLKFLTVGGITFLITVGVNYALKFTVLTDKPVTALVIATIVATIVSYVLNREWSFRARGGRERRHEAALFFFISGLGIALNSVPLSASRYLLDLRTPAVSLPVQEIADFLSGMIIGTLVATVFRWWAFRRWVFPHQGGEGSRGARAGDPGTDLGQAA